ncbi:very short patch repair endonuclease [Spirochaetia bacterium]|nr:very short patch repair endonuclease [Spirochaetia bacterium]
MTDIFSKEKRSEIMQSVKNKDTLPELIVQSYLRDLEVSYERNTTVLHCKPDIVIEPIHKVIFIHGCFWHGHTCNRGHLPVTNSAFWEAKIAKNKARDAKNYVELAGAGWNFLVIWGCEIKKKNIGVLKDKIARFLT